MSLLNFKLIAIKDWRQPEFSDTLFGTEAKIHELK